MGKRRGGDRLQPRQLHVSPPRSLCPRHQLGVRERETMAELVLSPMPSNWLVVLLLLLSGTAPPKRDPWFRSLSRPVCLFPPLCVLLSPTSPFCLSHFRPPVSL